MIFLLSLISYACKFILNQGNADSIEKSEAPSFFIQGFVIILLAWLAIRVDDSSLCMKTQE